jgi:glycosyltransferase involved in cell wall biosynthesis
VLKGRYDGGKGVLMAVVEGRKPDISILISCYNEERSVVPTIQTIAAALQRTKLAWEIIVVDDRSQDGSLPAILKFIEANSSLPIRVHRNELNRGLVATIFDSAKLAEGEYFWTVAGDNNVSEQTCLALLSHLGTVDLIIPQVKAYVGRSLSRNLISSAYATLVRILSGVSIRYFNGSSIYRRRDLLLYEADQCGFSYAAYTIIDLISHGRSYIEVPVIYSERVHGKSSALSMKNLRQVTAFFKMLLARRLRSVWSTRATSSKIVNAEPKVD